MSAKSACEGDARRQLPEAQRLQPFANAATVALENAPLVEGAGDDAPATEAPGWG